MSDDGLPGEIGDDALGSSPDGDDAGGRDDEAIPEWTDEYLDRVAHRLKFNFDLDREKRVAGETYPLYGRMLIESQKQFFHPALNYARQQNREHLFARRVDRLTVSDLERAVETGHRLADEWIDADEEHQGTEFTFVFVAPTLTDEVRSFVDGFRDRTLLRYGYYGHYEVNLVVVAPAEEAFVASDSADIWRAFVTWETHEAEPTGVLGRLRHWLPG